MQQILTGQFSSLYGDPLPISTSAGVWCHWIIKMCVDWMTLSLWLGTLGHFLQSSGKQKALGCFFLLPTQALHHHSDHWKWSQSEIKQNLPVLTMWLEKYLYFFNIKNCFYVEFGVKSSSCLCLFLSHVWSSDTNKTLDANCSLVFISSMLRVFLHF